MFVARVWRLVVVFAALGAGGAVIEATTGWLGIVVMLVIVIGGITFEHRVILRNLSQTRPEPVPVAHSNPAPTAPTPRPTPDQARWVWLEFRTYDPGLSRYENIDGILMISQGNYEATAAEARADLQTWLDDHPMADRLGDVGSLLRPQESDPDGRVLVLKPPYAWWVIPLRPGQTEQDAARDLILAERDRRLRSLLGAALT